jgi:hypothetical protein
MVGGAMAKSKDNPESSNHEEREEDQKQLFSIKGVPIDPRFDGPTRPHRDFCSICLAHRRLEFKRDYIKWMGATALMQKYGLKNRWEISRHTVAYGLDTEREACRRQMLVALIEYGADHLDELGLKARDVINAVSWLDKLDGLVVDRKEINGPPTLHLHAIPRPGGVLNKPSVVQDELAQAGPVVATYPRLKPPPGESHPDPIEDPKEGTNDG